MKGILNILENDAGVTSLLSAATAICYNEVNQGVSLPYIVIDVEDHTGNSTFTSTSTYEEIYIRVSSHAKLTHTESGETGAQDLAIACRSALDGISGTYDGEVYKYIDFNSQSGYTGGLVNEPHQVVETIYKTDLNRTP